MNFDLKIRLEQLLALRANLQGGMARMEDDSMNDHHRTAGIPTDREELACDDANQEIVLTLLGGDEGTLDQIEAAIQRLESGGYGLCRLCGKPIPQDRLDAIPYATECEPCTSREEEHAKS